MADKLSKKQRSWNMSRIRSRNTNPELAVRKTLSRLGFSYRLHRKTLPGKPDIVLPNYQIAIFVHGCFWHQHRGCIDCSNPKTNSKYWRPKLLANQKRDQKNRAMLRNLGWTPLVIWECETERAENLRCKLLKRFHLAVDKQRFVK